MAGEHLDDTAGEHLDDTAGDAVGVLAENDFSVTKDVGRCCAFRSAVFNCSTVSVRLLIIPGKPKASNSNIYNQKLRKF